MIDYKKIYNNIFEQKSGYNVHIVDAIRYDFVIDEIIKKDYKKIVDISSGRGYFIKYLLDKKPNVNITSTDLSKFNDIDVKFINLNLTNKDDYKNVTDKYDILICLDVLEHIEEVYIDDILTFFKSLSDNFCFTIANHSDIIDETELHLIQKDKTWWDDILNKHFEIVNSSDLYGNVLYNYVLKNKTNFCISVKKIFGEYFNNKKVLDCGSLDINDNNQYLFNNCEYTGIDIGKGKNVDIVTTIHEFNYPDESFDTIISTNCFQHDIYYKNSFKKICKLLKHKGLFLFTCATTGRIESGTINTTPEDSPFTSKIRTWQNYYKNLEKKDIEESISINDTFLAYGFNINEHTHDLCFWGIKK